jgi:hypothetical protein
MPSVNKNPLSLAQQSKGLVTKALDQIMLGKSDLHFVESGVSLFINQNKLSKIKQIFYINQIL